jgi:hypothetical protein
MLGSRLIVKLLVVPTRSVIIFRSLCADRGSIKRRIVEILHGDRRALKRAAWRVRETVYRLLGRPFREPQPRA